MDTTNTLCENYLHYKTTKGRYYLGLCEQVLRSKELKKYKGKVQLIFTSPPFPLNHHKKYGNLKGCEFTAWLSNYALLFSEFLKEDGSIVIELGNAWNPGYPTVSTIPLETLLEFKNSGNFHLCQEFIFYNPARIPSPAQWVTVERIRVKDAFTRFWWLGKTPYPKSDNTKILVEYSKDMKRLLNSGKYTSGKRPSEHKVGEKTFLKNNGGAIPSNVITAANTSSTNFYLKYCKTNNIVPHPARMPSDLAKFFIKFLSDENDLVMDPFAGSNVSGAAAESLGRRWLSIEPSIEYANGSIGRFKENNINVKMVGDCY